MNFFNFEGAEPLKRMREILSPIKKTSLKIAPRGNNPITPNLKTKLRSNWIKLVKFWNSITKKRLTLGVVNSALTLSLIAGYNPITTVKAQEVVPIAPKTLEPEVQVEFSVVHMVNIPKELPKKTSEIKESNPKKVSKKVTYSTNLYPWGQCTFYVKSKRADIPNRMGNAHAWFNNAKIKGFKTGYEARVGAIVVTREGPYGHVAMVEELKNGQLLISEMNFKGLGVVSGRAIDLSSNLIIGYIY